MSQYGIAEVIAAIADDGDSQETRQSMRFDCRLLEMDPENLADLLSISDDHPEYFHSFQIQVEYDDQRPPITLLAKGAGKIDISDHTREKLSKDQRSWVPEFQRATRYFWAENKYRSLANEILEIDTSGTVKMSMNVNKERIANSFIEEFTPLANHSESIDVSPWISIDTLRNWSNSADIEEQSQLFKDSLPIFICLNGDGLPEISTVPVVGISDIEYLSESIESLVRRYQNRQERFSSFQSFSGNFETPSPTIFDTSDLRNLFRPLFLYGAIATVSSRSDLDDLQLTAEIESDKGTIISRINLSNPENFESVGALDRLYSFFEKYVQRGDRSIYRRLWHQAIVEHCSRISDIPERSESIAHYYQSLEEDAIEGNFEDLSGAVQDAQIFIGDVTNKLSNSTVTLTAEIQKIVFALFGAVAANILLLVTKASIETAISFSIAFIAGLLILYFPTSYERVDELSRLIDESEADAEVYSNLVSEVGADKLISIESFEERQQAYIEFAGDRRDWAVDKLQSAFRLLSLVWAVAAGYIILTHRSPSVHLFVAVISIFPAFWIYLRHYKFEYYPSRMCRWAPVDPMMIVVYSILLGIFLRFL